MENEKNKIKNNKKKRKNLQELDVFWRKVILFTVLFVLAAPLTFLIVKRFTNRTANFNSDMIMKEFEVDEGIGESFLQIKQATQELQEQLSATTTTSTSSPLSTGTSTDDF